MSTCKPIFCSTVRFLVLILFFAALALSGLPARAQVIFSPPQNISSGNSGGYPQIAMDPAGNIYTVWSDTHIRFSRSTDGGITFSPPTDVSQNSGNLPVVRPAMALDASGNISVAWSNGAVSCCNGVVFL